jgi:hypothetical protein
MVVNLTKLPIAQQLAIKALLSTGKSERQTALLSGVSRASVHAVDKRKDLDPEVVNRIKAGLASKLYDVADRSLDHITDDKMGKSTSVQLMTTAAIGIDKARLIEGKTTSRTEYVNASDQAINDEIARLEGELGKWERGEVVNAEGIEQEPTTPIGQPAPETVDQVSHGAV